MPRNARAQGSGFFVFRGCSAPTCRGGLEQHLAAENPTKCRRDSSSANSAHTAGAPSSPYEGGAVRWSTKQTHPPFGRMGHPGSHSWCGTESAAGEGSLRCVISSVARNLSERFLGATNTVGPRNDKESAIGGRALRPPTLARRGWGTPRSRYTPLALAKVVLCVSVPPWQIP